MFALTLTPPVFAAGDAPGEGGPAGVQSSAQSGVISGFADLAQSEYIFEGQPLEEELTAALPQTLDVYLDGAEEPVQIPVSWEAVEDFDSTTYYFYSMRPVWDGQYALAEGMDELIDVPWITVFRELSDEEEEQGEPEPEIPMEDTEDLPVVYTPEDGPIPVDLTEGLAGNLRVADLAALFTEESYAASSNADAIYKYLTGTMGLNRAAACGVMTNLYAESGMLPNNLENRYNVLYGLTDKQYTSRVNKGKKNNGKYKSGYGKTRYFTKDYCGYGICQWTSLGRRATLLKLAVKKDVSIANLNMQLQFLQSELEDSDPQVWASLKKVPDNACGAYLAAVHFCAAFEIPANTNATAASRGKNCLSTYWKTYSGKAASVSGTSYLGICGYSYPKSVKKGKGITCSGRVISNYKIKSVTAKIVNSSGKAVYSKTKKPGTTVYSLYNFDSSMLFGKLSAGTYTYQITAKDSYGKSVTVKHSFTVSKDNKTEVARDCAVSDKTAAAARPASEPSKDQESTLRGSGLNYPKKIKKGHLFTIKGTVKSNYPLTKVVVTIKTKKGVKKQKVTGWCNGAKSYSMSKVDDDVKFGKLKKGTYYYIVSAKDSKQSKRLLKKKFTVR
ncbi:MAG: hypothetical protein IJ128_00655 [Firmicutes bacterium]|nr:hypothetical protein [Bacillota bacterium]